MIAHANPVIMVTIESNPVRYDRQALRDPLDTAPDLNIIQSMSTDFNLDEEVRFFY